MRKIERSALVPYSAQQMFELVDNIDDYPRFLPWCGEAHVVKRTGQEVEATLTIVWKGIRKSFTTRNHLHPYERIEIELVTGPFRHLEGQWSFTALAEKACKVKVVLEFDFTGSIVDKVFEPIFHHIANSLVEAFCKQAAEKYGEV